MADTPNSPFYRPPTSVLGLIRQNHTIDGTSMKFQSDYVSNCLVSNHLLPGLDQALQFSRDCDFIAGPDARKLFDVSVDKVWKVDGSMVPTIQLRFKTKLAQETVNHVAQVLLAGILKRLGTYKLPCSKIGFVSRFRDSKKPPTAITYKVDYGTAEKHAQVNSSVPKFPKVMLRHMWSMFKHHKLLVKVNSDFLTRNRMEPLCNNYETTAPWYFTKKTQRC
ncbi:hypothetical protein F5Y16DRAFT_400940 [Xylariaceae sp. FL0255]|nr:hypothetical protein F5Y16DRAFT_400940 [Xylariaceae sp. FL0255]